MKKILYFDQELSILLYLVKQKPHSPIQVILVATIPAVLSMRKEVIRALSNVIRGMDLMLSSVPISITSTFFVCV